MKAMVTGGAGFIGSNIVKSLTEKGNNVVVLDNLLSGYRCNISEFKNVRFIEGDIRDELTVNHAMLGVDVVFHLAASVGNARSIEDPIQDAEINALGTIRILDAARRAGVSKLVYSSSAAIYGEPVTLPIHEDHQTEPDSPYGATKLAAEKLCLAYSKLYSIQCICLRYFNVYGINQRSNAYGNVIPIFSQLLLKRDSICIYGDGEQTRDLVNVRDIVQANMLAYKAKSLSGAFNIGSGCRLSINRLAALISSISGIEARIRHEQARPGDVRHSLADISSARKMLGYEPNVGIEEGLAEYIEWAKADRGIVIQ